MEYIKKLFWACLLLTGQLPAADSTSWQNYKIVDLSGVFDINNNGQAEFFAVLENGFGLGSPLIIRHIEIDGDGFQQILWELVLPEDVSGHYVGLKLADLTGDDLQELVVLLNISEADQEESLRPVVYVFDLEEDGFSENPTRTLDLSDSWGYLRSNNLQIFDRDGDGSDELIVSLGSPRRSLAIIDQAMNGELEVTAELTPDLLKSGSGFIYSATVDYDRNGYVDLIAFSPEGSVLKIQPYYNAGGSLYPGEPTQYILSGLFGLLPRSISLADWDGDGFRDIILPFRSGHVIALTMTPVGVPVDELVIDAGPLSDLRAADFNQDDRVDLVLVSGEMNMLTLSFGHGENQPEQVEYFSLEGEDGAQVFQVLPVVSRGLYSGTIIAAGWNGAVTDIFTSDLGFGPQELVVVDTTIDSSAQQPLDLIELFPEILLPASREKPVALAPTPLPQGGVLPEGVLPRHILAANQTFTYTIPEDDMRQFYSFRWLKVPPKGMFFHYESRSINWVPGKDQFGAYQLAYRVEMKVGETVSFDRREPDSLIVYQMVPELDSYDERLWIYVNDPPQIISEPEDVEFLANALFTYQPQVRDFNSDQQIRFSLETKPAGMTIDPAGMIEWQTDSSHVSVYPVRLVASDGFDRAIQEFTLHPRAGVSIFSVADSVGQINEEYRYNIEVWKPDIDLSLDFILLDGPEGMAVAADGRLRWIPTPVQIDTQQFTVMVGHGIARDTQTVTLFINHPPVIEQAPESMNMIRLGETYDFQISAYDPNQGDQLQYTALLLPPGMRMDPYNGHLFWEPAEQNVDFSHLLVAVSDGRETRMIEAEFFVNAPIKIVSIPSMQAELGQPYKYEIKTADLNHGSLLTFARVIPIEKIKNIRIYGVKLADDVYKTNIHRYIGEWETAPAVYVTGSTGREDGSVSRLNLKKYVHSIFYEEGRLVVILQTIDQRTVSIKDVLWEFFHGNKGKPPKVAVERIPITRFSLLEFPDGMEVDELTGTITWTPDKEQVGINTVRLMASDGYLRDEKLFDIYVNHPPVIISKAGATALVGELYKYQIIAEDKNSDAILQYSLHKAPTGLQMSRSGRVVWKPKPSQINLHKFTIKVSDGYREDIQTNQVFVNINPNILSTPKPVALVGYEYRYKMVVEDLNKDRINFRPLRLPKYAHFNPKTGQLNWKPRSGQKGPNDVIIMVVDERGAATSHDFQIHVFEDPSNRHFVNTGWPLLLTFVGVMFAWGAVQI